MPPLILPAVAVVTLLGSLWYRSQASEFVGGAAWFLVLAAVAWTVAAMAGTARLTRVSRRLRAHHLTHHADNAALPTWMAALMLAGMVGTALVAFVATGPGQTAKVLLTAVAGGLVACGVRAGYAAHAEKLEDIAAGHVGHDVTAADTMMPGKGYRAEWARMFRQMGLGDAMRASAFSRHSDGDITIGFWVATGLSPATVQKRLDAIAQHWNVLRFEDAVRDPGSGYIKVRFSNNEAPERPTYAKGEESFTTTPVDRDVFDINGEE